YRYILEEAKAANKISPVSESPIDPFGATGLSHDLADDVVKPVKEQAENKIDGAVALIMAVGRAMLYEKEDTL
ncbi:terminase large subunit, partial [Escherichia coli]|nr:terminase large subunit [Escherichia coli]